MRRGKQDRGGNGVQHHAAPQPNDKSGEAQQQQVELSREIEAVQSQSDRLENDLEFFALLLNGYVEENQSSDKDSMVYRSDLLWFAKELQQMFQSVQETAKLHHRTVEIALSKQSLGRPSSFSHEFEKNEVKEQSQSPSKANASQAASTTTKSFSDIDGLSDNDDDDDNNPCRDHTTENGVVMNGGPHEVSHDVSHLEEEIQLLKQEAKDLKDELVEKDKQIRSQQIEIKMQATAMETINRDLATARKDAAKAAKAPPISPLDSKIVGAIACSPRESTKDVMRQQIVALARALEESEKQRADLLNLLQRERAENEKRLACLKDAINKLRLS